MIGSEPQRRFQSRLPARQRLAGHVVQQVQVDGLDAGDARLRNGRGHVRRGVAPAEAPQLGAVEALRTERDAVDAELPERSQVATLIRAGVGLERDLRVGRESVARP